MQIKTEVNTKSPPCSKPKSKSLQGVNLRRLTLSHLS